MVKADGEEEKEEEKKDSYIQRSCILQMTCILFPGLMDPTPKIFAI